MSRPELTLDLGDPISVEYSIIKYLLGKSGFQSRISSTWRQSAGMLMALRAIKGPNHYLDRYLQLLLAPYARPPFHEAQGKIHRNQTAGKVISILPLLIYGAGHLITQLLTNTISDLDALVCIQHWMDCTAHSFQDAKLKTQKLLRGWLPDGLRQLPREQIVPYLSLTGALLGVKSKTLTSHTAATRREMIPQRERMMKELSHPVYTYVTMLSTRKDLLQLMKAYQVCRVMSNDGTYFAFTVEVTIDAAVLPRVVNKVLPTLQPSSLLTPTQVLSYDQSSSAEFYAGFKFLSRIFSRWRASARKLLTSLDKEIVPFLTTSSSGGKVDMTLTQMTADPKIKAISQKRILAFAYEYTNLLNLENFRIRLAEPVKAVERTQIGRRARAIAGVNNLSPF